MVIQTHFSDIFATLSKFREEGFLCDTVIVSSDKELQVHGLLLAAVSPVFKSAFTDSSKHGRYVINLTGVESAVIEIALHFIYTGKLLLPHVYTQSNELPKLFAALQGLGLEPHKLNGCEVKFKSPEDTTMQKPSNLGETPIEIKLYNKPQLVDITALKTENNTEKVPEVEDTTKQKESNEPDDGKASAEEPLQQPTSPSVSDVIEEVVAQEDSAKAVEGTPQVKKQRKGTPHRSKNNACSVQNDLTSKTTQSSGSQSMMRKIDESSPLSKMKQTFNADETRQMNGSTSSGTVSCCPIHGSVRPLHKHEVLGNQDSQVLGIQPPVHVADFRQRRRQRRRHTCLTCGKLSCTALLKLHQHLHIDEKPHICNFCKRAFSSKANLDRHEKQHTGIRPHLCELCGKGFIQKPSLRQHMLMHQEEKKAEIYKKGDVYCCSVCGLTFSLTGSLRKHMQKVHLKQPGQNDSKSEQKKSILCNLCGKGFASATSLKLHNMRHTGEKPFQCSMCNKSFVIKTQLEYHIRLHTGEKPFVCLTCGKRFVGKLNLTQHMRIHTGEKPYICTVCNKRFTQATHLKSHMLSHTGEKPNICHLCGKAYKNRLDLRFHYTRIHGMNITRPKEQVLLIE